MSIATRLSNLLLPKAERIEINRFNSLSEMARSRRNQNDDTTKAVFLEIVNLYSKFNLRNQREFDNNFLSHELGDERWFISKLLEFKSDLIKLGAVAVPIFKATIKNNYCEKKLAGNSVFPVASLEEEVYVPFLAELGSPALPALIEGLKDPNGNIRRIFAKALGAIKDRSALEALSMVIENSTEYWPGVKEAAIYAIRYIGKPSSPRALEALINHIYHNLQGVEVERAIATLGNIADPSDKASIKVLKHVLERDNHDRYAEMQRMEASYALGKIGGELALQALGSAVK